MRRRTLPHAQGPVPCLLGVRVRTYTRTPRHVAPSPLCPRDWRRLEEARLALGATLGLAAARCGKEVAVSGAGGGARCTVRPCGLAGVNPVTESHVAFVEALPGARPVKAYGFPAGCLHAP